MSQNSEKKSALDIVLEQDNERVTIFPHNAPGEFVASPFAFYGTGGKGYCDGVEFWLSFTDEGYQETFGSDVPRLNHVVLHNNPDTDIIAFGYLSEEEVPLSTEQQQKISEIIATHTEDAIVIPSSPTGSS